MLEITNVRNGSVLNHNHGRETADGLEFILHGIADPNTRVTVNGKPAERADRLFQATLRLDKKINPVSVVASGKFGDTEQRIVLAYDKKSFKRCNFFIDDNVFFLTDLAREKPKSLFDHFYLGSLRETHRKHGMKFTLNCFYENNHDPFKISAVPDTWKSEWRDNSDWLRLSFHAYSEFPDRPYQHATNEKLAADFDLLKKEIVRFAGEETFIPPTVIHWAMCMPQAFSILKERGVSNLIGGGFLAARTYLGETESSLPVCDIGYYYERDVTHYLKDCKKIFYDRDFDLFLANNSCCCNLDTKEEIVAKLKAAVNDSDFLGIGTHEQYSFPRYFNYLPDHLERIDLAARTTAELGYQPVFFSDGLMGNTAWE